ncbi:hypothetical protein DV515_00004461 [Chloebia gouldiae]|uniref:Uncharacterized protein n=1 Tax=Chloebia gouldiae TaxID=44316 RepID=A0A3L8ST74_CHLGU|nr:hypothetical protein DV515_00004461 [Chloebia gouldiae]
MASPDTVIKPIMFPTGSWLQRFREVGRTYRFHMSEVIDSDLPSWSIKEQAGSDSSMQPADLNGLSASYIPAGAAANTIPVHQLARLCIAVIGAAGAGGLALTPRGGCPGRGERAALHGASPHTERVSPALGCPPGAQQSGHAPTEVRMRTAGVQFRPNFDWLPHNKKASSSDLWLGRVKVKLSVPQMKQSLKQFLKTAHMNHIRQWYKPPGCMRICRGELGLVVRGAVNKPMNQIGSSHLAKRNCNFTRNLADLEASTKSAWARRARGRENEGIGNKLELLKTYGFPKLHVILDVPALDECEYLALFSLFHQLYFVVEHRSTAPARAAAAAKNALFACNASDGSCLWNVTACIFGTFSGRGASEKLEHHILLRDVSPQEAFRLHRITLNGKDTERQIKERFLHPERMYSIPLGTKQKESKEEELKFSFAISLLYILDNADPKLIIILSQEKFTKGMSCSASCVDITCEMIALLYCFWYPLLYIDTQLSRNGSCPPGTEVTRRCGYLRKTNVIIRKNYTNTRSICNCKSRLTAGAVDGEPEDGTVTSVFTIILSLCASLKAKDLVLVKSALATKSYPKVYYKLLELSENKDKIKCIGPTTDIFTVCTDLICMMHLTNQQHLIKGIQGTLAKWVSGLSKGWLLPRGQEATSDIAPIYIQDKTLSHTRHILAPLTEKPAISAGKELQWTQQLPMAFTDTGTSPERAAFLAEKAVCKKVSRAHVLSTHSCFPKGEIVAVIYETRMETKKMANAEATKIFISNSMLTSQISVPVSEGEGPALSTKRIRLIYFLLFS